MNTGRGIITKILRIFLLVSGLILLVTSVISLFYVNINFGLILILGLAGVLILYGLFFEKLVKIKWLTYGILAVCASFLIMMLFIGIYGQADNAAFDEDAVIVLGSGIRGEEIPKMLSDRLDKAAEYFERNPDAVIIVSGGRGPGEDITEALAMERYLTEKGIPAEKIIKEEEATSTYENLLFSKEILNALFGDSYKITVITNDFHIYRAASLARKLGYNVTHYSAGTALNSIPAVYSRECAAVVKMWLFGR